MTEAATLAGERWQTRRSGLNHEWLRNKFLNSLSAFIMRLQSKCRDREAIRRFLTEDLKEWPDKAVSARQLLSSFEKEMSPARLVDEAPLCRAEPAVRRWLAEVTHLLWLSHLPVRWWLETATTQLDEAARLYGRLCAVLNGKSDVETCSRMVAEFQEFEGRCRELSDALSKLPAKIIVV